MEGREASEADSVVESVACNNICCCLIARCSASALHMHSKSQFRDIGCNSMNFPGLDYAEIFQKCGYLIT